MHCRRPLTRSEECGKEIRPGLQHPSGRVQRYEDLTVPALLLFLDERPECALRRQAPEEPAESRRGLKPVLARKDERPRRRCNCEIHRKGIESDVENPALERLMESRAVRFSTSKLDDHSINIEERRRRKVPERGLQRRLALEPPRIGKCPEIDLPLIDAQAPPSKPRPRCVPRTSPTEELAKRSGWRVDREIEVPWWPARAPVANCTTDDGDRSERFEILEKLVDAAVARTEQLKIRSRRLYDIAQPSIPSALFPIPPHTPANARETAAVKEMLRPEKRSQRRHHQMRGLCAPESLRKRSSAYVSVMPAMKSTAASARR